MSAPNTAERIAAESWFLKRGLPSVLTKRARWRRLWRRSAPALAALASVIVVARGITVVSGGTPVDIDNNPTAAELVVLGLLATIIPIVVVVAWLVSGIQSDQKRRAAAFVAVVVMAAASITSVAEAAEDIISVVALVGLVLVVNGLGVGSVLGWAVRMTLTHLASVGALFARALPVVLLTVLVFFNGFVWSMATTISRDRMWLVIGFMVVIAVAFLVSGIVEHVRPMLASISAQDTDNERLADTPFAAMPDPITGDTLSRGERTNVYFVVAVSQITQIATVAIVTAAIFISLGLLALSPELLADWTHDGSDQGTVFGMLLPVSQSLIHVTMFLGALTFMYVSARAVGDGEYREEFLDPLLDDLRLTLVARSRYRKHIGVHQT